MAVYKDEKTGKWMFRVYVTNPVTQKKTQRKRRGFELRRDAIEAEAKFLSEYKTRSIIHSNVKMDVAIDNYFQYEKNRLKITTHAGYVSQINKHIRPYFGNLQIRRVSNHVMDNWYETIKELDVTAGHKNKLLTRLKAIFTFIEQEYDHRIGYIHNLPPFQKKPDEKKRPVVIFDEAQFNKFVENSKNQLERVIFKTLFFSGLRISELRGLRWTDVNLENRTIDVKRQMTSKVTGSPSLILTPKSESSVRTIHIPNELLDEIIEWKELRSSKRNFNENWQVFGDYGTVHENTISRMIKAACERANLPHITPHQFRHSYVTLLFNKQVPPAVIKEQLGHSSIQVTLDIYNHLTSEQKQQAIDKAFNN